MPQHLPLRARIGALFLCLAGMSVPAAAPLAAQTHHFVYLSMAADRTISGFELDPAQGTLTPIAESPFNPPQDPGAMALHPSGRFLYVLNAGAKNVSAYAIDPVTGVLTEAPASPFSVEAAVGYTPKLFVVEPSGKFLYVVSTLDDPVVGTITSLSYYEIDQDTGAIAPAPTDNTLPLGVFEPAGLASKPGDRFLYLVGTASPGNGNDVWIFTLELDDTTATVSAVTLANALTTDGQFAQSVAIDSQGRFLFVGRGQSEGSIDTYKIDDAGDLQLSGTFSIPGAQALPYALAADASGSYLYAVASLGILGFSVDPVSGVLTSLPGFPQAAGVLPSSVLAADPVEEFLYFDQRAFAISGEGALDEVPAFPLLIAGSVTGIAAANPLDAVLPISAPVAQLAPLMLQFSEQTLGTTSQPQPVVLANTGKAPLIVSSISLTGIDREDFDLLHACLAVVNPGDDCVIEITFGPLSGGAREAALTVEDDAIGSPHTVPLTGTGGLPFTFQHDSLAASVVAGQMAQYDLQLVPAPGFVGEVLLSCSGAPAGAVCDVPLSLQLDGSTHAPLSVKVRTTARSITAPLVHRSNPGVGTGFSGTALAWGAAVMILVLLILSRMRPTPAAISWTQFTIHCAAALLLVGVSLGLASCAGATGGGRSSSQGGTATTRTGTPAGLYELTLTATFGSATQTVQLDLDIL